MLVQLDELERQAQSALEAAASELALAEWSAEYLGRKGRVTEAVRAVGSLPRAERPAYGKRANQIKQRLEGAYEARVEAVMLEARPRSSATDQLDVTLPGREVRPGRLHPITRTMREIYRVFAEMGFQVYLSRDVETDDHNFTLLNMPPHHPARDMWDTFYTRTSGVILRTHTSPGQIHAMRQYCPEPIRVILPGMCYRYEQVTTRAEIMFTQVEGLAVGKNINMADLKGTITDFAKRMFGEGRKVRFRATGCRLCKFTGWLEIMGCGMVHPVVLKNGGYDPRIDSGFAFGMGPERITMLKYRIDDIRYFWGNDLRFLEQFG
jgi:phenylalanyl-tRNA synthetase alpha chain